MPTEWQLRPSHVLAPRLVLIQVRAVRSWTAPPVGCPAVLCLGTTSQQPSSCCQKSRKGWLHTQPSLLPAHSLRDPAPHYPCVLPLAPATPGLLNICSPFPVHTVILATVVWRVASKCQACCYTRVDAVCQWGPACRVPTVLVWDRSREHPAPWSSARKPGNQGGEVPPWSSASVMGSFWELHPMCLPSPRSLKPKPLPSGWVPVTSR